MVNCNILLSPRLPETHTQSSLAICLHVTFQGLIYGRSVTVSLPYCRVSALVLKGRLGLGTQDTHNSPQQVCLPVEFEAQRVVCGVDCSMIISAHFSILACGSNR